MLIRWSIDQRLVCWRLCDALALGNVDDLANLERLGNLVGVGSLNLSDGDASLGSKGAECVTTDDSVLGVGARAALADWDVDLLADRDVVKVGDLSIGALQGVKGDVEVVGNEEKSVVGDDEVGRGVN